MLNKNSLVEFAPLCYTSLCSICRCRDVTWAFFLLQTVHQTEMTRLTDDSDITVQHATEILLQQVLPHPFPNEPQLSKFEVLKETLHSACAALSSNTGADEAAGQSKFVAAHHVAA